MGLRPRRAGPEARQVRLGLQPVINQLQGIEDAQTLAEAIVDTIHEAHTDIASGDAGMSVSITRASSASRGPQAA